MNTGRRAHWLAGAVVLAGLLVNSPTRAADVRLVGSDLLGLEFTKAIYEFSASARLPLAATFDGSRSAIAELKAGRADAAIAVIGEAELRSLADCESTTLAYHRVLVLVPTFCPVDQITLEQLAAVVGPDSASAVLRWNLVGVKGEFGESILTPLAPDAGLGLTLGFVRQRILQGRRCGAERYGSADALAVYFRGEARVLALAADVPPGVPVKTLAVAAAAGEPAFLPTPENLHSGDYPLGLPVRLVWRRERTGALRPLLARLLSEAMAAPLRRAGLVPAPAAVREQQVVALGEKAAGNPRK